MTPSGLMTCPWYLESEVLEDVGLAQQVLQPGLGLLGHLLLERVLLLVQDGLIEGSK